MATDTASTGTQDNDAAFSGSPNWLPLTGDGGDSGFDEQRSRTPASNVHRRTDGHQLQRRRPELVAVDRRRVHRRDRGGPALLRAGDLRPRSCASPIFVGAQRVWRTQDLGGDPRLPRGRIATPLPTSSARATCSTRVRAARRPLEADVASLTAAALEVPREAVSTLRRRVSRDSDAGKSRVAATGAAACSSPRIATRRSEA